MQTFNVSSVGFDKKIGIIEHIFDNMEVHKHGLDQLSYMLGGDTGVGKTSFVKDLAELLGLSLVLVETPHLVEEHIINIPFVVFPEETKKTVTIETDTDFYIKLGKSALYTEISKAKKIPDAQYLKNIYASKEDQIKIFEQLGGSKTMIPDDIKKLRDTYDCILFLDEYYRQTSAAIRNMLRSILNGKIGSDKIPGNIYVLYASNLIDEGVGKPLEQEAFRYLKFDAPDKDEWFAWLVSKFKDDKKVKLDPALIDKFYTVIKQEDLSSDDADADVRTSPRRWEQLLLYINSSLPVKTQDEANHLMTNVHLNFKDYESGKQAVLAEKVVAAVKSLIKETSNIEVNGKGASSVEWRDTLQHQIEQKIKLGEHRKYVTIVSGMPGIGKTKHINSLAAKLNLVPAVIDVGNLSIEEVIGTPLPKTTKTDIEIKFSKPPLLDDIEKQLKAGEKMHLDLLKEFNTPEEAKRLEAEYKKADYKYLIFFDELNRPSKLKVFNAIRKVLLEKSFGDGYKLPEGSIILGAINPTGQGTLKLTKHMRDVLDIIPTGISWAKFNSEFLDKVDLKHVDDDVIPLVRKAFEAFVDHFKVIKSEVADADPQFFLDVADTPMYMSPRDYNSLYVGAVQSAMRTYKKCIKLIDENEDNTKQAEELLRKSLYESFTHVLHSAMHRAGIEERPQFEADLKGWFEDTDDIKFFVQQVQTLTLKSILDRTFDKKDEDLFKEIEFVNYIGAGDGKNIDPHKFKEDLEAFLREKIKDDLSVIDVKKFPKKSLDGEKTKVEKEEVSKLEFVARELVHALKVHKLSNNMMEAVKQALRALINDFTEHDSFLDLMQFNKDITNLIKTL